MIGKLAWWFTAITYIAMWLIMGPVIVLGLGVVGAVIGFTAWWNERPWLEWL